MKEVIDTVSVALASGGSGRIGRSSDAGSQPLVTIGRSERRMG